MEKPEMQYKEGREKHWPSGWKFALIRGLPWAVFVFFFTRLLHLKEESFSEIYFSRSGVIGLLFYIATGIFIYLFLWWFRQRDKKTNGDTPTEREA